MIAERLNGPARALVGHPPLLRACLIRAAIVWLGIRAFALLGRIGMDDPRASLFVVLIVAGIIVLDAKVTRELLYLRNLGLPPAWLVAWVAALCVALETAVRVAW